MAMQALQLLTTTLTHLIQNKTEYGSTTIGSKNGDTTVADYSNIG